MFSVSVLNSSPACFTLSAHDIVVPPVVFDLDCVLSRSSGSSGLSGNYVVIEPAIEINVNCCID